MSEADMDSIRVLWREGQEKGTPSGVAGWNDRVAVFKDLQKIIGEQSWTLNTLIKLRKLFEKK